MYFFKSLVNQFFHGSEPSIVFTRIIQSEYFCLPAVLSCTDTADSYTKDKFVVDCPAGCDGVTDKLWGTTVYTDDSYICAAAIHDGRIRGNSRLDI